MVALHHHISTQLPPLAVAGGRTAGAVPGGRTAVPGGRTAGAVRGGRTAGAVPGGRTAGAATGERAARALAVRDLGPADEGLVERLHDSLSPRSQYQRFHGAKPRLSARDRRFLASADGHDHVALVALDAGVPVAIARFVRLLDRPQTADIAAEVVDERQRQGIGNDLIARLARRAAALGVHRFSATVLSETGLGRSLGRRGWRVASADGPTTTLEVDVWTLLAAAAA